MKRTILTVTAALVFLAGVAFAERFIPAKGTASSVKIEGTSTLHDWTMEGTTINGQITSPSPEKWNGAANGVVTIPVTSIKSEHAKMDKLMAESLKAAQHPEIRFELTQAAPAQATADSFVMKTAGKLTIAGVTRDITLEVKGTRNADGRYTLVGSAPIRMSDYGIKPPTAMMNTIRTGNDVKVTFRWVVDKTN
ncbi:MAG TPA: YceI family protein [Thermoanaerobaculia bacterium]|nr:YceI family protein [Thermoanaerobaculia bacterium]